MVEIEDDDELLELEKERQKKKEQEEFPFLPVDMQRLLQAGKNISCDVFIQRSNSKLTRVFSRDSGLDFKRVHQYIEKGVKEVFVRKEDWKSFVAFISRSPDTVLRDDSASAEERSRALIDLADQSVSNFFQDVNVHSLSVEKSKAVVKRMMESMMQEPKLLAGIMRMVQQHDYLIGHAVSVSIISMILARTTQNFNDRTLEICGSGGFLHDIGKCQIEAGIVNSYNDLSPEQWREMRHHPRLGVRMLEGCQNISDEVRLVVGQHHEQPGGSGYPDGLRGPKIFYPAKIVSIADGFAAMISEQTRGLTYTPEQAIHEMQQEQGKYDRELLDAVGKLFSSPRSGEGSNK